MGLVNDQGIVAAQHRIRLDFRQKDAVRHQLDEGRGADLVGETHLIANDLADLFADLLPQFRGDSFRDGARGDTPGLGVADHPGDSSAQFQANLGDLRRLARTGLTRNDDNLMLADGLGDFLAPGTDGKIRERNYRKRSGPSGKLFGRERTKRRGRMGQATPA